ncbi:hypothetical protein CEXT_468701, partial [Caerostris extrusa]
MDGHHSESNAPLMSIEIIK